METTPFFKKVKENLTGDSTRSRAARGFLAGVAVQKVLDHTRKDWNNNVKDIQSVKVPPNNPL